RAGELDFGEHTGRARVQALLGQRVRFLLANVLQMPRPSKLTPMSVDSPDQRLRVVGRRASSVFVDVPAVAGLRAPVWHSGPRSWRSQGPGIVPCSTWTSFGRLRRQWPGHWLRLPCWRVAR